MKKGMIIKTKALLWGRIISIVMNNRYREEEKLEKNEAETTEEKIPTVEGEEVNPPNMEEILAENKKLKDQYLRVLADAENFKRRIDEERIRERKYGSQKVMEKLVSALDIFDQAVNIKTDDEKLKNFLAGFMMINNSLKQLVEEEGVKPIKALNEPFDPRYHHAVETDWDETVAENMILQELQRGYTFKDRVLRASLVKVNKKPDQKTKDNS